MPRANKYSDRSLLHNPANANLAYKTLNKEHKLVANKQDAKRGDLWVDPKNNMLKMNMGNRWLVINDPNDEKNQRKIKQKFDKIIKKGNEREKQSNRYLSPPNFKKWNLFIDDFYKKMQFEKTSETGYYREKKKPSDLIQRQKTMLENYSPPIYLEEKLYEDFKLTPIKNPICKPNLVLPSFFLFLPNNEVITIDSFENGYFINDIRLEWQGNNLWRESKKNQTDSLEIDKPIKKREKWHNTKTAARILGKSRATLKSLMDIKGGYLEHKKHYIYQAEKYNSDENTDSKGYYNKSILWNLDLVREAFYKKNTGHMSEKVEIEPLTSKVRYYKNTEILSEQSSLVLNVLFFLNCVKETTIKELGPIKEIETNEKNVDIIDLKPRLGFLLGEDYKKRVVYKQDKNNDFEILSKKRHVRPHWRKGHWHTVLQGPKRKNRKMRWFRPCFVMGKSQETLLAA